MSLRVLDVDLATYQPHPLHHAERIWQETNCYVDLWIEVLHALRFEPLAGCAFTLASDFEGDQWAFFKFPPEDLRLLFGVEVAEMNIWKSIEEHVVEQLELGRLVTLEADAWYLPDTAGVSYRVQNWKTTIVPNEVDRDAKRLVYFHNAGYYEATGEDYDGLLQVGFPSNGIHVPYVETIRLDRTDRGAGEAALVDCAVELTRQHLRRRPDTNPVIAMRKRLVADLEWLSGADLDTFHRWAFVMCRQCGSNGEIAAAYVDWLAVRTRHDLTSAATALRQVATDAKSLEFALARLVRGRTVDVDSILDRMAGDWDSAMRALSEAYGA